MSKTKQPKAILGTTAGNRVSKNLYRVPELTDSSDIVPEKVFENYETTIVSKDIDLSMKSLVSGEKINCSMTFENKKGIRLTKNNFLFNQETDIMHFSDVKEKPSASAGYIDGLNFSKVKVTCTQNDMHGEKIKIYIRSYEKNGVYDTSTSQYYLAGILDLKYSQTASKLINLKDRSYKGKVLIVRLVSVSMFGRPGAFRDVIVNPRELNQLTGRENEASSKNSGILKKHCVPQLFDTLTILW